MLSYRSFLSVVSLVALSPSLWAQDRDSNRREDGNKDSQYQAQDRNSKADSNDSLSEWFSDWWSDDDEQNRKTGKQQNLTQRTQRFISRYDDNDDDQLSHSELPPEMQTGFDSLDRNGNNQIDRDELQAHVQRMAQRTVVPVEVTYIWIQDTNSGRAKLEDLQSAYDLLCKIDENDDGQITRTELRDRHKKIAGQWINKLFEKHDDNDDDQLTRDELANSTLADSFDKVDADSDGKLERTELRTKYMRSVPGTESVDSEQKQRNQNNRQQENVSQGSSANRERNPQN